MPENDSINEERRFRIPDLDKIERGIGRITIGALCAVGLGVGANEAFNNDNLSGSLMIAGFLAYPLLRYLNERQ